MPGKKLGANKNQDHHDQLSPTPADDAGQHQADPKAKLRPGSGHQYDDRLR
jgi:hypothetical protein